MTCLLHVSVIAKIKENLNATQLEMFKASCFGHFLSMSELKFSTQIVHNMLLCQCHSQKEDKMWILIDSEGLRFGGLEFALIAIWLNLKI